MSKPYLIIGGGGFIGRHLTRQLVNMGEAVRVLDIIPRPLKTSGDAGGFENIEWHQGSITNPESLKRAMQGVETVFHLAALAHLGVPQTHLYEQVNTHGTQNVIDAAKAEGVSHLLITSTEVILRDWREALQAPLTVPEALPPLSAMAGPYCRSKHAAEIMARRAIEGGMPISILYPSVPIGPGDYNLTAPTAMLRQFLDAPPPAYLDCRLNLIAVEDVARAHILAAKQAPGGKYMLGGEDVDMSVLLEWLAPLTDKKLPKQTVPYALAALTAHISQLGAKISGKAPLASVEGVRLARRKVNVDSAHTVKALGWNRGPVKEAVERAAQWLRSADLD